MQTGDSQAKRGSGELYEQPAGRIMNRQTGLPFPPCLLPAFIAAIAISFTGRASDNNFASRVDVIARHSLDRPNAGISIAVARDGKLVLARADPRQRARPRIGVRS